MAPSRAPARAPTERTSLSPRGTRAAGPWGRPWPPPECAPRGHSGQRRARVAPPAPRRADPRVPGFQFARLPPAPALPRPRSRPPRSPPGRGTENLESWRPGESANARQDPRFPDSQLADSRSLPATAAAGLRLAVVIALASRPCPNSRCWRPAATRRAVKRA